MTFDNDQAFSLHKEIAEKLNIFLLNNSKEITFLNQH